MISAEAICEILDEARERMVYAHILMERDEYILRFGPRYAGLTSHKGWTVTRTWGDSAEWTKGELTIRIDILRDRKVVGYLTFGVKDVYKVAIVDYSPEDAVIIREVEA